MQEYKMPTRPQESNKGTFGKILNIAGCDNYIGAATFLEMYEAFMQGKKIYIFNDYPNNMLLDEIKGFNPTILNGDLSKI